ncbi:Trk system potassium transporter TrkA [Eubacterium oxidoreducens]|uniref:Trk system potassium uptake protein TrkA n=1 Tax=Eubacterium oxidoreducens TaxID=1732 RepID=A0A1G6BVT0_EUBOX|nr:Trk system potassium transporter TrkA [Eubacterium oxidoreducens]SDB24719.1 trk system potassium uptake protein TrkA [Eubacterium oxidoreducens]
MQIIVVGCGNVGRTLIEQLVKEGHDVTAVDLDKSRVEQVVREYDVMGYIGNGASRTLLIDAGVKKADVLLAVTAADELNLLCCLIARKAGDCKTIARVRNPIYTLEEVSFIKEELGLSLIINPEMAAAHEIARLIKFPSAIRVENFAKGRLDLLGCRVKEGSELAGCALMDITSKHNVNMLVIAVQRKGEVVIPNGQYVLEEGDVVYFVAEPTKVMQSMKKLGNVNRKVHKVMIIGGGETTVYLSKHLLNIGIHVTIIESSKERCGELSELLPNALVICGDGTDRELLLEEGIESMNIVVAWTNFDEENIMLSLYAQQHAKAKAITKIHKIEHDEILQTLDVGSICYPKKITAERILQYIRAMNNSMGSNVETLYQLVDDRIEVLEFVVRSNHDFLGIPLEKLHLKKNLLIACIVRAGKFIIPGGKDEIRMNDSVIVVTMDRGLECISDIMR